MTNNVAIISCDKEVIELALERYNVVGFFDRNEDAKYLVPNLGRDEDWERKKNMFMDTQFVLSLDCPSSKIAAVHNYGKNNFVGLISEHAYIGKFSKVGLGCVIQIGAKVMANARLGDFCKVNVGAVVHHDSRIGSFCTLSPGCQILGAVTIGDRVQVGAGAIILPHKKIGDDVIIGAGAVVTRDVPEGRTVKGIPAE